MRILTRSKDPELSPNAKSELEERFSATARSLGAEAEGALLELDIERAPAEGRSAEPYRLVANLSFGSTVLHAEAVKPSPESAADRVKSELDHEIRRVRGKEKNYFRRGGAAIKKFLRFEQ